MGSTPLDLPVLISQMHYVAKIAHAEKAGPEVKQQLFGPLINDNIRQQESKVQQVNKKDKTDPVDRDGKQNEQSAQFQERREKEKEEESQDTGSSSPSPWSGNIINVKI